jgi:hypothetical protein
MGNEAENVLKYWSGDIRIGKKNISELRRQVDELTRRFRSRLIRTLDYPEYLQTMCLIEQQVWDFGFLDLLDESVNTELVKEYKKRSEEGQMTHGKGYILCAAMTIGREIAYPTYHFLNSPYTKTNRNTIKIDGSFIPKTRLGILGEYDGVAIPEKVTDPAKFDFMSWLKEKSHTYLPFEQKLLLRPRFNTGVGKVKKVFSWDIDQVRHRLGRCILEWDGENLFPLPREVMVVYQRGLLPAITHYLPIDGNFWSDWYDDIDRALEINRGSEESEEQKLALALINIAGSDPIVGNFRRFPMNKPNKTMFLAQKVFDINGDGEIVFGEIYKAKKI